MQLSKYQEEAKRTCSDLGEKLNLAHMVLGIGSETEEVYKAAVENDFIGIGEEIADKFWYIANYCSFRNIDFQYLYDTRNEFTEEAWEANSEVEVIKFSKLQDYIKKYIAYNKPIDPKLELNALRGIVWSLTEVISNYNADLNVLLERNIAKLKARFPEKFTEEAALNRNLVKERSILEGNEQ